MLAFFTAVLLLIAGYFVYGMFVERVLKPDAGRQTPAYALNDGVDYDPMPLWKVYLTQLLDIAGIGPIFGPILGALYGPKALIWIVAGCIFAGGVHDYFSGMMSVRDGGKSVPEVVGDALGNPARHAMRFFSVLLLLLVGVVFVLSPAKLLGALTGWNVTLLVAVVFLYYFIATIIPIHTLIGHLYPLFGLFLLFMTLGVGVSLIADGYTLLPNLDVMHNTHPDGLPAWPRRGIVLSCGAVSGFHSTQSPLMARCLENERHGRMVFYGAMVTEGIIALIWATVGMSFYRSPEALQAVISAGSPSAVVNEAARTLLGPVGGVLAVLGVIVLPITSGDTAFRSTRLIFAEALNLNQKSVLHRLMIAVPLFIAGFVISRVDFNIIWRYFGWANQTLAMLVLWTAAVWLVENGRRSYHWIASLPAAFMSAVSLTFLLYADIGFRLPYKVAVVSGIVFAAVALGYFLYAAKDIEVRAISDAGKGE